MLRSVNEIRIKNSWNYYFFFKKKKNMCYTVNYIITDCSSFYSKINAKIWLPSFQKFQKKNFTSNKRINFCFGIFMNLWLLYFKATTFHLRLFEDFFILSDFFFFRFTSSFILLSILFIHFWRDMKGFVITTEILETVSWIQLKDTNRYDRRPWLGRSRGRGFASTPSQDPGREGSAILGEEWGCQRAMSKLTIW